MIRLTQLISRTGTTITSRKAYVARIIRMAPSWATVQRLGGLTLGVLLLLLLGLTLFGASPFFSHVFPAQQSQANVVRPPFPTHLIGGFSIYGVADARNAAANGIQTVVNYRTAYPTQSAMGRELGATLHMTQIEAQPWELLYQYECHRLILRGYPQSAECAQNYLTMSLPTLLAAVKSDILSLRENNQVVGVWALDDWPATDLGGAKAILPQIAAIVHTYAPGVKVICGFGAGLGPNGADILNTDYFDNFTPQGCDVVAMYIYSVSVADPTLSPAIFDWSMRTLLPKVRAGLLAHGWNPKTTPLIGIPQAFGGTRLDAPGTYEITPTADDIALQSQSFCAGGASGIAYYAWQSSGLGALQTAANNTNIAEGVHGGIELCQRLWKTSGK